MVTHRTSGGQTNEYYGKSSDTKPIYGVPNASIFYEIDTGVLFMFDEDSQIWINRGSDNGALTILYQLTNLN